MMTGRNRTSNTTATQMVQPDCTGTGMIILSPSLSLMSINPEAGKILGTGAKPGRDCRLENIFGNGSLHKATRLLKQVFNSGITLDNLALKLVHTSGRQIPCNVMMLPLIGKDHMRIGAIVRFTPLTHHKGKIGQYPRLSFLPRMDYPHLFDGLPQGVFSIDTDWRIQSLNKRAEQLTGFNKGEVIGKYCWQVFQAGHCQNHCPFSDVFDNACPSAKKEMTLTRSDGTDRRITIETAPVKDSQGNIAGGIASLTRSFGPSGRSIPFRVLKTYEGMVGSSMAMKSIFEKLPDIAQSAASVLITGENGTGKELVARAIHNLSLRKDRPFQAVNCTALPQTLLESELFGHEKGSFTGADAAKPGRFELADDGTFFLDEIGDMSPSLQVKLLRVLEQKEFERVGSDKSLKMKARIIAATNQRLNTPDSPLREDLYYRLRTVPIHLPPLRERTEDIPLLVDHFIAKFNHKFDKQVRLVDPAVLSLFMAYDWPGNIRELERVMEYAFVFVKGPIIFSRYLPENQGFNSKVPRKNSGSQITEKDRILKALEKTGQKKAKAAQLLGISRTSLWRKMKVFGLLDKSSTK